MHMKNPALCFGLSVLGLALTQAHAACTLTSPSPAALSLNYSFLSTTTQPIPVALTCDAPGDETGYSLNVTTFYPSSIASSTLTGRLVNALSRYLEYQIQNLPPTPLDNTSYALSMVIPSNQYLPSGFYTDTVTFTLTP